MNSVPKTTLDYNDKVIFPNGEVQSEAGHSVDRMTVYIHLILLWRIVLS